jgi:hypothetical protein
MQFHLDKTVVLCAITRLLEDNTVESFAIADFQRMYDVLTGSKAHLIQSVDLSEWDIEYLEKYLEDV